jgi:hypothetical protein
MAMFVDDEGPQRELTKGEAMVRLGFNPGGDPDVVKIKAAAAACIDMVERFRDRDGRCCALAQTAFEDAAMWAVKCITTGKP